MVEPEHQAEEEEEDKASPHPALQCVLGKELARSNRSGPGAEI